MVVRIIKRSLIILVAVILLVISISFLLFRLPMVQRYLGNQIALIGSETLQTEVKLTSLAIYTPFHLTLKELYVADTRNDTLAYIGNLDIRLDPWPLFDQTLSINTLELTQARIYMKLFATDSTYNFDFFPTSDTTQTDSSTGTTPWNIGSSNVRIEQTAFRLLDEVNQTDLKLKWERLNLDLDKVLLADQHVAISSLNVQALMGGYTANQPPQTNPPDTELTTADIPILIFPFTGWEIVTDRLSLGRNQFAYHNSYYPDTLQGLDPNHIELREITLEVQDFEWDSDKIMADIQQFSLREKSGFYLDNLTTDLELDTTHLSITPFEFRTLHSFVRLDADLSCPAYSRLLTDPHRTDLSATLASSSIGWGDIELLKTFIGNDTLLNGLENKDIRFRARIDGNLDDFYLNDFQLNAPDLLMLSANAEIQQLMDVEKLAGQLDVVELSFSPKILKPYLATDSLIATNLDSLDQIVYRSRLRISPEVIEIDTLTLAADTHTTLSIRGYAREWKTFPQTELNLDIQPLTTSGTYLARFLSSSQAKTVKELGDILFTGTLSGKNGQYKFVSALRTQLGGLSNDLEVRLDSTFMPQQYKGEVNLEDLQLGSLTGNQDLGKIAGKLILSGEGSTLRQIEAQAQILLDSLFYNGHLYKAGQFTANARQGVFVGELTMSDPLAQLDTDFEIHLSDTIPTYRLKAVVDTLATRELALFDDLLGISGDISVQGRGDTLSQLIGQMNVSDLHLSNDTISWQADSINIVANLQSDSSFVRLSSDFASAYVSANKDPNQIAKALTSYITGLYPDSIRKPVAPQDTLIDSAATLATSSSASSQSNQDIASPAKLNIQASSSGLPPILATLIPGFRQFGELQIDIQFDEADPKLDGSVYVSDFLYDSLCWKTLNIQADGVANQSLTHIQIDSLSWGSGLTYEQTNLYLDLQSGILKADFNLLDSSYQWIALSAHLQQIDETFWIRLGDTLMLNNRFWQVDTTNYFAAAGENLSFNDMRIYRNSRQIAINGGSITDTTANSLLQIDIKDFPISDFTALLKSSMPLPTGMLSGNISLDINQPMDNPSAKINIGNLSVDSQRIGDLQVSLAQVKDKSYLKFESKLIDSLNQFNAVGHYNTHDDFITADIHLKSINIPSFSTYLTPYWQKSEGMIAGEIRIEGAAAEPQITGKLYTQELAGLIDYTQTYYTIQTDTIRISPTTLDLGKIVLADQNGQSATVTGSIAHEFFNPTQLKVDLKSNQFQFLNKPKSNESLFYGQLSLTTDMRIRGTPSSPRININAETVSPTSLYLLPLSEEEAIASTDYIIYDKPLDQRKRSRDSASASYGVENPNELALNLNLDLTPEAELTIVIDPVSGDKLVCRGAADLTVDIQPNGDMQILGRYDLTSGSYTLNYEQLIKKQFNMEENSYLIFTGDPLEMQFDITATYTTSVSPYPLIKNETNLSPNEIKAAQQRMPISVVMRMEGTLNEPKLQFDIRTEASDQNTVYGAVTRKLQSLRDDESELNKQVFGLLLLNNFIGTGSSDFALAETGEAIVLSSVSKLLTNQLNQLADKYVKGVEIDLDVSSYQNQYLNDGSGATVTQLQLGLSKQLFNDRLKVKVGGNYNLESDETTDLSSASFSSLAGDFVLEYKLTQSGSYLLKVYRRENIDRLIDINNTQTGVGIFFQKSFKQNPKKSEAENTEKPK